MDLAARIGQSHLGTDAVPVALGSSQFQSQPVIPVPSIIAQAVSSSVTVRNHNVDVSVIIQITKSRSPTGPELIKDFTGAGRDVHKGVPCVSKQQRLLAVAQVGLSQLDVIHHMAVGQEQIFVTIIIVVK